MKTALLCFWFAFAAVQVGLAFSFHSLTFIEIGVVIPLMIAFNLQRVAASRSELQTAVRNSLPDLPAGSAVPLNEELVHSHAA